MRYKLLTPEEIQELSRTATREEIIDRLLDLLEELGAVTHPEPAADP